MLDLALACDLKVSDPAQRTAIRTRHQGIKTRQDAADYIREVENRVHSRRKVIRLFKRSVAPVPVADKPHVSVRGLSAGETSFAILFLLAVMVAVGWFAPVGLNLFLVTLSMLLMMMVLGLATTNRPLGILINERNLMSLARFQMVIWTAIILSGFLTFALMRIKAMADGLPGGNTVVDALNIGIDWHLWALLGISTTSLVGASLILSTKKDLEPAPDVTQKVAQMVNEPEQAINNNKQGTLYANQNLADARLTDMFEGDELINTARIDLAKVQMFYFTIIAVICFFAMIFKMLIVTNPTLDHLPTLPDGLVAILGISHAGYLGSKSVSRTQSQP